MSSESDLDNAQKLVRKNKKACIANLCEIIHKKLWKRMVEYYIDLWPL